MLKSLPDHPHLDHLRKEAKAVLKAHSERRAEACHVLRSLRQFRDQSDPEILATPVQLHEVQYALSRQYGFKNWSDLKKYVESRRKEEADREKKWDEVIPGQVRPESLARFALRNADLPQGFPYLGGGVPAAIMQILRHGGDIVDFPELTAASGWGFSFGYDYNNHHVAALRVGHFAFLPRRLGYETQSVSCADKEAFWSFVKRNVDAEIPMACTHYDGGLVVMFPLLIATVVFVAYAREKVIPVLRWLLLFPFLVGAVCRACPLVPEFRAFTVPVVKMFE